MFLRDIWPDADEVREAMAAAITEEQFTTQYGRIWDGDEHWQQLPTPTGPVYDWDPASTYVARAAVLRRPRRRSRPSATSRARGSW